MNRPLITLEKFALWLERVDAKVEELLSDKVFCSSCEFDDAITSSDDAMKISGKLMVEILKANPDEDRVSKLRKEFRTAMRFPLQQVAEKIIKDEDAAIEEEIALRNIA